MMSSSSRRYSEPPSPKDHNISGLRRPTSPGSAPIQTSVTRRKATRSAPFPAIRGPRCRSCHRRAGEQSRCPPLILGDDDGVLRESVGPGAPPFGFLHHVISRAPDTAAVRIVVYRVEEPVSLVGIVDLAAVLRHQALPQDVWEGAPQGVPSAARIRDSSTGKPIRAWIMDAPGPATRINALEPGATARRPRGNVGCWACRT